MKSDNILNEAVNLIADSNFKEAKKLLEEELREDHDNIEILKNLGLCYVNLEDFKNGIKVFKKLVELNSEDASSYYYLAVCYDREEDILSAEENYKKVIGLRENFKDTYKALGLIYMQQGRFEDVIDIMDKAIKKDEEGDYQFYYFKGSANLALRKESEALIDFKHALELEPCHIQLMNNIATCSIAIGNIDEAQNVLLKAYEIDDKNAVTLYNLGTIYQLKGEDVMAFKYFEEAYENEANMTIAMSLASCALRLEKYECAIKVYKAILKKEPNKADIKTNLMLCLTETGDYIEALKLARELIELRPKSVELKKHVIRLYSMLEEYESAIDLTDSLIKRGKIDDELLHQKAKCLIKMNDFEKAESTLKSAVDFNPKNADIRKDLGLVYLHFNHSEWAKDELLKALELDKENDEIIFAYATFLNEIREFEEAEKYYKEALDKKPENMLYLSGLGGNYLEAGKIDEASIYLRKAYAIDPKNIDVAYKLARLYYNQKKYKMAKDILEDIWNTPNNADIVNLLGLCYMKLKDYKKALIVLDKLSASFPKNHIVLGNLAECAYEIKEYERASDYALRALEIFADYDVAIKILKKIKEIKGQDL